MDFEIIDIREREAYRRQKIEWFRRLIDRRRHNVAVIRRYISLYGNCFSPTKQALLAYHLVEVDCSIQKMEQEYQIIITKTTF